MPRIALDTNVLVYSEGLERTPADKAKIALSQTLLEALSLQADDWLIPAQALAELHSVLVRRVGRTPAEAGFAIDRLAALCDIGATSARVLAAAIDLAAHHHIQIYDAIIVAAAVEAGCELLLSEDLHDGFAWGGVTVTNPFRSAPDERVARLLSPQS